MPTFNIDREAMRAAGDLLKLAKTAGHKATDIENLATKGLGVVLEQGLYAGLLYFYSQKDPAAKLFVKSLGNLSAQLVPAPGENPPVWEKPLSGLGYIADTVCQDLQQTIWVKTVWEQALTYVRYGAKALDKAGAK